MLGNPHQHPEATVWGQGKECGPQDPKVRIRHTPLIGLRVPEGDCACAVRGAWEPLGWCSRPAKVSAQARRASHPVCMSAPGLPQGIS